MSDINFSIMKGDKVVIDALVDSVIMNFEKGNSTSLSEEESYSAWLYLSFLF